MNFEGARFLDHAHRGGVTQKRKTLPRLARVDLLRVVVRLAPLIRLQALPADHLAAVPRRHHPPVPLHDADVARGVLCGHLAADGRAAAAVTADQQRLPFHRYFSPAAGKTGRMSTGMSFSFAVTVFISGVSLP